MDIGRIIGLTGGLYKVLTKDNEEIFCRARGKLRSVKVDKTSKFNSSTNKYSNKLETKTIKISPKVGDMITYDFSEEGINYIIDIMPRKNELIRPDISNVDQILLLFSAKKPDFSSYLLDLFLVNLEKNNINPVIIVSKIDLLTNDELNELKEILKYYENIGYKVIMVNSKAKENIELIIPLLKDKISVLSGQTGAGKSTLINALIPGFNLATQEISKALNRGKHTTRQTTLYQYFGGLIGDTPGFSKLDLSNINIYDLNKYFIEFANCGCKFKTCTHITEPNCEVMNKVNENEIMNSRYTNYVKMYNDLKNGR